jgi:hypothetical protein
MIDVSKIKVGDTLEFVPVKVEQVDARYGKFHVVFPDLGKLWFDASRFASHIPAPRPFEKGDRVTWGSGNVVVDFVAEHDGRAVYFCPGSKTYGAEPLANVRHADLEERIVITDQDVARAQRVYADTPAPSAESWRAALIDLMKRRAAK